MKTRSGLQGYAFYGLLCTILLSSIPNGAVEEWQKLLVVSAICTFGIVRIADGVFRRDFRVEEPFLFLPLIGVLAFASIQLVPLPGGSPITTDKYDTEGFILVFAGILVAGEMLFFYTRSTVQVKGLIALVVAVGVASASYGLARDLFFGGQLDSGAGQSYAQFINRNHFSVLMEMVLGVLLGLLIKGGPSQKLKFAGWTTVGFLVYSMIAANSRGGLISLGALGVFAVVLHAITRSEFPAGGRSRSLFGGRPLVKRILVTIGLCSLVLAVVIVMIAFVGGDRTVTRIEQLKDEVADVDKSRTNRRLIWTSTLELIKESPVIGTGFGAYSTAITKFDISGGSFRLQQAHNDYLELLASGGIFGASLFILFSILLAVRTFGNLKSQHPLIRSASFGGAIGIFGVLVHSVVDFGLHVMVNALIFTVLVVLAGLCPTAETELKMPARRRWRKAA